MPIFKTFRRPPDEEAIEDTIGTSLIDSSSIDFTYDDPNGTITAAVIPGGVNHNALANLTTGNPHTQYVLGTALNELVDDRVAVLIQDGAYIDWIYNDIAGTLTGNLTLSTWSRITTDAGDTIAPNTTEDSLIITSSDGVLTIRGIAGANAIKFTFEPGKVHHNSLSGLTTGDPHTQYVKDAGTPTDNAIVRFDGTDGRTIQNSGVIISDTNNVTGVANLTAVNIGLGGAAPDSTWPIDLDGITSSTYVAGAVGSITHTGTSALLGSFQFTIVNQVSSATTTTDSFGAILIATQGRNGVASTSTDSLTGASFVVGIGSGVSLAAGSIHLFSGATFGMSTLNTTGHGLALVGTYGAFFNAMPTLSTPLLQVKIGAVFNEDCLLALDKRFYVEGGILGLGDSYFVFNSATTDWDFYVDNVRVLNLDQDICVFPVALGVGAGTGTATAKVGGVIEVNTTTVGNVGTGEDDLMTFSVPANTIATAGSRLDFLVAGRCANNVNGKRIRVYFGSTLVYDSTSLANVDSWSVSGSIISKGATSQICVGTLSWEFANLQTPVKVTSGSETATSAITFKVTGTATANNDIEQDLLWLNYYPVD